MRSIFMKNGTQKILTSVSEYKVKVTAVEDEAEFKEKNQKMREQLSHKNYDFSSWPLFTFEILKRKSDPYSLLCGSINLLVCDGDSLRILLKELTDGIKGMKLPDINYSYREYVNALTKHVSEEEYETAKNYWMDKMDQFPDFPHLPSKVSIAECKNYKIVRRSETIHSEEWETFKEAARINEVSPSALLCAIYGRVLAKWSNQKDLLLNMTAFERLPFNPDVSKILGDFTKILPLEVHIDSADIWQNSCVLQKEILSNLEHKAFDGTEIIRELSKRRNCIGKAIMPVVFTCVLFDSQENWFEQIGKLRYAVTQTPQVLLDNQMIEMNQELYISWDYAKELFEPEVIEAVFHDFICGIRSIVKSSALKIPSQLAAEAVWNKYNPPVEAAAPRTLSSLFERQVQKTPDHTALIYKKKDYTYAYLEKKANQAARYLCQKGICGGNARVGVLGVRKPETIISILGILKTGAAYVPIDPKFPKERQSFILEDSGCRLLLTEELYESGELNQFENTPIGIQALPDSLAYIIYTSGSTGKPKGVMISHMAVCNTIEDLNEKIRLHETDRLIGISSVCFDLSVYDIFAAFSTGAGLVMVEEPRDSGEMISLLEENKVTVWNSVPILFSMAVQHILERTKTHEFVLRQVMLSGDWIPVDLPGKARDIFKNVSIMSLGGATEASIWSIYYEIESVKPGWNSIPYGVPLKNQSIYVLNFAMELCPEGVVGEIYIGGEGVAQGYCNDIEKTKSVFIEHHQLGRIYKTGDMGVLHKDGYIEFLGRTDHQVKIRGYRIELGEIEAAISRIKGIKENVVSFITNGAGNKQLAAYYIPEESGIESEVIKAELEIFLPTYMIPQYYLEMNEFPLSANGKLDRKKLPLPVAKKKVKPVLNSEMTQVEKRLWNIWKKVFDMENIHIFDDFYTLGGDSIILMRLLDEINLDGLTGIQIEDILELGTIEKLAKHVEETDRAGADL